MTLLSDLPQIRGVKNIPTQEGYTSGHRTCQGCESALVMRLMIKAAGPRTIVVGSTGCMYVANTTYYSTPWVVPWMHTQLGSSGSAATGTAAALSGRVSFEIVVKAARAGVEIIAAVSAPTTLAIQAAQRCNITLCGFVRDDQATIYCCPHRIIDQPKP